MADFQWDELSLVASCTQIGSISLVVHTVYRSVERAMDLVARLSHAKIPRPVQSLEYHHPNWEINVTQGKQ